MDDIRWLDGGDDLHEAFAIRLEVFCDEQGYSPEMELDELDRQAHEILQKEFPDDEDIPGLALTDITIDKSGCYGTFSLCYDTGDSPAGELYLNVSFDEQFVPSPKVGYDTF